MLLVCAARKGMVFKPFWSENGSVDFERFGLKLGMVIGGTFTRA